MKVVFPFLQVFFGLLLLSILLTGYDIVYADASQFQEIGVSLGAFFYLLPPIILVLVLLLILPLYRSKREGESWRQFFKRDWLAARLILAYLLPIIVLAPLPSYRDARIEELRVPSKYFDDYLLQARLQKSLPFNIGWTSDQDGPKIYFAKEPGRADKVEAALTAIGKEPKPSSSGE
jgi:hypothetical protein